MPTSAFAEHSTKHGELPPWEIAKAIAYSTVLRDIGTQMGCPAHELIGQRVDAWQKMFKAIAIQPQPNPNPNSKITKRYACCVFRKSQSPAQT